jgi:hypothetical protein
MWPTLSTPAPRSRKPRTNTRKCGTQSAYQSLQTVVSVALPPALRNGYTSHHFATMAEIALSRRKALTTNIRVP